MFASVSGKEVPEPDQIDHVKLRGVLLRAFNLNELRLLCADFKTNVDSRINFADIHDGAITTTVLNLVGYCERRGHIIMLADYILTNRPQYTWHDLLIFNKQTGSSDLDDFEFVNRAYEIDLICKPGAPRFTLVDGAAGYGKTYLLYKVKKSYESNERETWKAAYIDLKFDQVMRSEDKKIAWPLIANAIILQFTSSSSDFQPIPIGTSEKSIINELVPFLNRHRANILLLVDGIEALPRSTSIWLKRLMYDLDRGLGRGQRKLRVVFSGRYVRDWGRGAPYALTTIPLSPFNSMAVHEMIDLRANALKMNPDRDYLNELTWQVLYISGGHPQGICSVLDKIAEAGFIFNDIERTFFQQQFQSNGEYSTLFKVCIEPIIQTLISDLESPLQEIFRRLSPIRRFDSEILDHFLTNKLITNPKHQSSWELIRAMLKTHLIGRPKSGDPMFSDQIVRRMLAMQLQLNDRDFYRKMNAQAQILFDERACKREEIDTEVRRAAIIESLYHTLQLASAEEAGDVIQNTLIEKLNTYLTGIDNPRDRMQLQDALTDDVELNDLINRRTGNNTSRVFLDTIEDQIWA